MGRKKSGIVSLSLPDRLVEDMGVSMEEMGYSSRSELVRDALRSFLKQRAVLKTLTGRVDGVITLLYEHENSLQVSEVRHQHMDVFRSFMHSDLNESNCGCCKSGICCEVLIFSGDAESVRQAFYELSALKNVEEAQIFVASTRQCHNENHI